MDLWAIVASVFWIVCSNMGESCTLTLPRARVTEYAPELGGGNCMEPCHLTGYLEPIEYGVTAACGLNVPYGTTVTIQSPWWTIERKCADHGGAIDNDEIDVAVRGAESPVGYYGYFIVTWKWEGNPDELVSVHPGLRKEKSDNVGRGEPARGYLRAIEKEMASPAELGNDPGRVDRNNRSGIERLRRRIAR